MTVQTASYHGQLEIVKYLIEKGADIDVGEVGSRCVRTLSHLYYDLTDAFTESQPTSQSCDPWLSTPQIFKKLLRMCSRMSKTIYKTLDFHQFTTVC